jgi:DNA repair protein RadC
MTQHAWCGQAESEGRAHHLGMEALSNAELLATMLRGGNQHRDPVITASLLLIAHNGLDGLVQALRTTPYKSLGIGKASHFTLLAALELGRRRDHQHCMRAPTIHSPHDAVPYFRELIGHLEREALCVLVLNTRNRPIGRQVLYQGTANCIHIRVGEIFQEATRLAGVSILVSHNHPGGDASPSSEDIALTRQLIQAGELLDIEILDHIVLGAGQCVSMRERGLGFTTSTGNSPGWRVAETQQTLYQPRRRRRKEVPER